MEPSAIVEPALGPTEVIAYRVIVPESYVDDGALDAGFDQNPVTMRMFFWREGPWEDCFVFRIDAFRSRHGSGIVSYGEARYVKLDDPLFPNPLGTMIVVDLPLNNPGDDPAYGLGLPGDLMVGDFLAFELNIVRDSLIDENVSYGLFGVEFFDSLPWETAVQHATVFNSIDDVDCDFFAECTRDRDCDDGEFCNSDEICNANGRCEPGVPQCTDGQMCHEIDDECIPCDGEVEEGETVLCHRIGADGDPHTLVVGLSAVSAHLNHGDTLGACPEHCP